MKTPSLFPLLAREPFYKTLDSMLLQGGEERDPEEHWRRIRTNNSLERILREIPMAYPRAGTRSAQTKVTGSSGDED
jgi:hypothetical protein